MFTIVSAGVDVLPAVSEKQSESVSVVACSVTKQSDGHLPPHRQLSAAVMVHTRRARHTHRRVVTAEATLKTYTEARKSSFSPVELNNSSHFRPFSYVNITYNYSNLTIISCKSILIQTVGVNIRQQHTSRWLIVIAYV